MTLQAFCIHGHFYQPPREDPFSGFIPLEPGAEPFPNWNERIHAECYQPNSELRNFERISFNIGPTLFEWMQVNHSLTSQQIVQQDQANLRNFGVGNAISQPYHHTILPLAIRRDKETQILWGISQFEHRFKRKPQGMWLPEAAVDYETLDLMAENGIEYTILAPWQAKQSDLDCTEPYRVNLPSGNQITVFFYHRELSTGISFNPMMTSNADYFLREFVHSRFNSEKHRRGEPQILLVASDGELYGHHQSYRDLFLARLMNGASSQLGISRSYPALWLRYHQVKKTVEIFEKTSWSCHHGVLRWQGDCPCIHSDGRWKAYLRYVCDRLAEEMDNVFVSETRALGIDPWQLRNRYIHVLLGEIDAELLLTESAGRSLKTQDLDRMALLLEAQHQRQRMFASCGFYFDDFSRIEPKNCLAYAAKSVVLIQKAVGYDITTSLQGTLSHIVSHKTGLRGDIVFDEQLDRANRNQN